MPLACTGINHRTAPVALRERLALGLEAQRELLHAPAIRALGASAGVRELVILSTCNRTELYAAPDNADAPPADLSWPLLHLLAAISDLPLPALRPHIYDNTGLAAVQHLCRVAAGLDSMVVGESEVLGQVAAAFRTAAGEGAAGPVLEAAFRAAIRAGRRARTETGIGRRPASVSSEAVRLLTEVAGDPERLSVLIVGTGKMGRLAGQALRSSGVRALSVVSRTAAHAEAVAGEWGATALGWHDLAGAVRAADAILCSTGAPHAVVTREVVERAIGPGGDGRRRVFVDIAVPRDVEPGVAELPGVQVFDLDALQQRLRGNVDRRRREIPAVERIVNEEVHHFAAWRQAMTVRPLLTQMHARGESIRRREVERLLRRVGRLPPELAAELEAFSQSLVTKLLHEPTRRLREPQDPERSQTYFDVTRELFGLDGGPQGLSDGAA
jgi:glutamyl-tRNA reductase